MYKVILLDIDDTLFDYEQSENYALTKVFEDFKYFEEHNLEDYRNLRKEYREINDFLWKELEKGNTTSEKLKIERFSILFDVMKLDYDAEKFSKGYLKRLGEGAFLFEGAMEFCEYVSKKYKVAIITNGLKEVQTKRIKKSGIGKFADAVIISEEVGVNKPHREIFEYALKKLGHVSKNDVIMIGDSQTADIQGGINIGIDTCWVNIVGNREDKNIKATYSVTSFDELYEIV